MNFRSASVLAMRQALGDLVNDGQLADIAQLREEHPTSTVDDVLKLLQLSPEKASALQAAITDSSQCYSLWVVAHGKTRDWYRFYVTAGDAATSQSPAFGW
jgi:hypothetical protein